MSGWGPFSLEGKHSVVTGAAAGIGAAVARRFVEAGANVVVVDQDGARARDVVNGLVRGTGKAFALELDVTTPEAADAMVAACVDAFGSLDVFVNNAGAYPAAPAIDMEPAFFDRVLALNVRALVLGSQAAARQMVAQGTGGRIINMASISGLHPSGPGMAAYDTSKGAVVMFTKSFALEMAPHGVLVNAIAPGEILTDGAMAWFAQHGLSDDVRVAAHADMVARKPVGRLGDPDDVATAAVFLASPASSFVVGEVLVVDGGMVLT